MTQNNGAPHTRRPRRHPRPRTAPPRPLGAGRFSARVLLAVLLMVMGLALATGTPAMATVNNPNSPTRAPSDTPTPSAPKTLSGPLVVPPVDTNPDATSTPTATPVDTNPDATNTPTPIPVDTNPDATNTPTPIVVDPDPDPTNTPAPAATNTPTATPKPGTLTREVVVQAAQDTNVGAPINAPTPPPPYSAGKLSYSIDFSGNTALTGKFKIDSDAKGQIKVQESPKLTLALDSYGNMKVIATYNEGDFKYKAEVYLTIKVVAPTPTPTPTATATPAATNTPTPTATTTATPAATNTPGPTPTNSPPNSTTETRSIAENAAAGANVGAPVTTTDPDGDKLTYKLKSPPLVAVVPFEVASDGQITVRPGAKLNYEKKKTYEVTVVASDGTLTANITVTINVTDVNEAPLATTATRSIAENATPSATVGAPVTTTDPDDDTLIYSLTSNEFEIDPQGTEGAASGQIVVKSGVTLDHETTSSYSVTVVASDGKLTTNIPVTINVTDVNEAPVGSAQARSIAENAAADTTVGTPVTATDPDDDTLTYSLTSNEFAINSSSGQLTVKSGADLDYETTTSYSLTVTASDGTLTTDFTVTVTVTDVDEAPDGSAQTRSVPENAAAGDKVGAPVTVTDPENKTLTYALTSNEFAINASSGQLTVKTGASLDYETKSSYSLTVTANDGANTTSISVTINVTDVNEAPNSTTATRSIAENSLAGTTVGAVVTTTDPEGAPLTYTLTSNEFAVGQLTGQLTVKSGATLDHETTTSYAVTVTASDSTNTTDIPVTINVTDVNELPVFEVPAGGFTVVANVAQGSKVGTPIRVYDPDGDTFDVRLREAPPVNGKKYGFSIEHDNIADLNDIGPDTTVQLIRKGSDPSDPLEAGEVWTVILFAQAGLAGEVEAPVKITVLAAPTATPVPANTPTPNPGAPVFPTGPITREVLAGAPLGTNIGAPVTATDPDTPLRYSLYFAPGLGVGAAILADNFAITQSTGQLVVAKDPKLILGAGSYGTDGNMYVRVQDSQGTTSQVALIIKVVAPTPLPTATPPPTAVQPTPTPTATATPAPGNQPPVGAPFTRSVAENAAAGTTVGAPVTVSDSDGDTLTYSLTANEFAINATSGQITVATGANLDYETQSSYAVTVTASDGRGGTAQYTVTIYINDVDEIPAATPTPTATPIPNGAPSFGSTTATRSVAENSPAGTNVGDPVTATDPDGDPVGYLLVPTSSTFTIAASGQIAVATGADLDYETTSSYTVIVYAYDSSGDSAKITVTINVTDVDETPAVPVGGGPVVRQPSTITNPAPSPDPAPTAGNVAPVREQSGLALWQLILLTPVVARRRRAPVPVGVQVGAARTTPQTALAVSWRVMTESAMGPVRCAVQYRPDGARRWQTQHSESESTALTLEGLQADTRYEVRVQAAADEHTSRWVPAGAHRTAVAVQPITMAQEPVIVGWEAPAGQEPVVVGWEAPASPELAPVPITATPQLKPVPITITPPPVVLGWTAA